MFKKILIANRGEIACRVMRTARRMGIATVAVYSEADASALHVAMADEAVPIGAAPSAESYLVIERILQACRDTGAEAVHPGYGFLSENQDFAKALADAGIAFIGPNIEAIAAMGDKIASKKLAQEAGVSTVPGHVDVIKDVSEAIDIANKIGYPVMIKASAGGGGKGMRVAYNDGEAEEGFRSATNEAKSSFGDDRIFVEKFIEEPRHIEIQVLADSHGNTIFLGERECSIQRRHQKVIEEAPSPFLDAATRQAMGEEAVALARAVNYRSAGTVEFIVDKNKNFYFLEMNTRLQVEHPVTEMITGLDLVEQMIRVAAGEALPLTQSDVTLTGWSMEARVYAEDPLRNFLPSIGRLTRYIAPDESAEVRVDSGIVEGSEISMYYDPMIAKLVTHGTTRDAAADSMIAALNEYYIRGVNHNGAFLSAVMSHPRFLEGRLSTNFIADEYPDGFHGITPDAATKDIFVAVAAAIHMETMARAQSISGQIGRAPGEYDPAGGYACVVKLGTEQIAVDVTGEPGDLEVAFGSDGDARVVPVLTGWSPGEPLFFAAVGGEQVCVQVDATGIGHRLCYNGVDLDVLVMTPRTAALDALMPVKEPPDMSKFLLSPMPGLLISLAVTEGQEVKAGEELATVEAMKMENVLRATNDGKVATLHAAAGDSLAVDQPIIEFD